MAKKLIKIGGKLLVTNKLISIEPKPLILKMNTTQQDGGGNDVYDKEATLHLNSDLNYDFTVDWGDGTTEQIDNDVVAASTQLTHKYDTPGEYIVKIYGVFGGLLTGWEDDKAKYMEVTQWGDPVWESLYYTFSGCENLKITATDVPNWQNVISAMGCFQDCTSLETIPDGLFDNCTEVTNFKYCFDYCDSLETIPTGLFDNCTKVTNFYGCFYGCTSLTSLPTSLFDNCTEVTDFGWCFNGCTSLTSLPTGLFDNNTEVTNFGYCFINCTSLETLPTGLFDNCIEVTDFSYCFRNCTSLTSLPTGLFDNCTEVTDFRYCFYTCTSLETLPTGLFDNNTKVTNFGYCFGGCTSLTSLPSNLFDNCIEVTDFGRCFRDCTSLNLSGTSVSDWSVGNVISMREMFQNCTNITDILGIELWEPFKLSSSSLWGMRDMLNGVTLPTTRYSDMLINFASKAGQFENTGITLHGGNSKYNSAGEEARDTLTSTYSWNIDDGGLEI